MQSETKHSCSTGPLFRACGCGRLLDDILHVTDWMKQTLGSRELISKLSISQPKKPSRRASQCMQIILCLKNNAKNKVEKFSAFTGPICDSLPHYSNPKSKKDFQQPCESSSQRETRKTLTKRSLLAHRTNLGPTVWLMHLERKSDSSRHTEPNKCRHLPREDDKATPVHSSFNRVNCDKLIVKSNR